MEVMYLLIAFSLLIASGFLLAFMWAVRSGQYDDRYTPSVRILLDDIRPEKKDADGSRNETVDGVGNGEERYTSEIRAGSAKPASINKSSNDKEKDKKNSTGPMDGNGKAGFDGKYGSNQRGGSLAAAIRSQEHHPKPKTRR